MASFGIVNDGNADVEINLIPNNANFVLTLLGPVIVPKAVTTSRTVKFTAPAVLTPQTGEFAMSSTNPANKFCAPPPAVGLGVAGSASNGLAQITLDRSRSAGIPKGWSIAECRQVRRP